MLADSIIFTTHMTIIDEEFLHFDKIQMILMNRGSQPQPLLEDRISEVSSLCNQMCFLLHAGNRK